MTRIERFLANPPERISPERVRLRRRKNARRYPSGWLEALCSEQRWRCAYCSKHMMLKPKDGNRGCKATIDHVQPLSRGGRNRRTNVVAACDACNTAKGSRTVAEWRAGLPDPFAQTQRLSIPARETVL